MEYKYITSHEKLWFFDKWHFYIYYDLFLESLTLSTIVTTFQLSDAK